MAKRASYMLMSVATLAISISAASSSIAQESTGQPFIKAAFYKKNISLEQFRVNPRGYFEDESAFRQIVKYVSDEIGQPLSAAQFIALIRSDRTRTRACRVGEMINTGARKGNEFDWFHRLCRPDEEILQVQLDDGRWIDVISLNCLNGVEDPTPVPVPVKNPPITLPPAPKGRCSSTVKTRTEIPISQMQISGGIAISCNFGYDTSVAISRGGGSLMTSEIECEEY